MRKPRRIETRDRNNKPVRFTLKKGQNTSGTVHFRVTGTLHKEHIDKKFKQRWEAEQFVEDIQKQEDAARSKLNAVSTTLTQTQVNDATAAFDRLPDEITLGQVVEFYLQHKPKVEKSIKDAYDTFIAEKERVGRRFNTLREIKSVMKGFVRTYGYKRASTITEADLVKFIQKGKVSAHTENNRQKVYNKFFNYCLKQDWVSENPLRKYDKRQIESETAHYFSVSEAQKILETVKSKEHQKLLPYITLMLFCGLRNSEASKLKWENIRFDGDDVDINVDAKIAKTASRRSITAEANAARILHYCRDKNLTEPYPKNFRKSFEKLKQETGIEWRSNALRHTFGTYRFAFNESDEKTSKEMGNSPAVLKKYYDGLASKREAVAFFSLDIYKTHPQPL